MEGKKLGLEDDQCLMEELPDEILSTIISFLGVKEATRTSILSKRWKNLYLSMPRLNFSGLHKFNFGIPIFIVDQKSYVKLVDHFMQQYANVKIESFRLEFPQLNDIADRCIQSAVQMGAEDLNLTFLLHHHDHYHYPYRRCTVDYCFSFSSIHSASAPLINLKHLHLHKCCIKPVFSKPIHSLVTLELKDVAVDETVLECIFLTCVNLRKLLLWDCNFPPNLSIACPSISLKCLQIFTSRGTPENWGKIKVSGLNLTYIECGNLPCHHVKLFFSNVPKLEEICLMGKLRYQNADDMFNDFANDAHQLKRLLLLEPHIPVVSTSILSQIKDLELTLLMHCNPLEMIPILVAFPLLKKFHMTNCYRPTNAPDTKKAPCEHHFPQPFYLTSSGQPTNVPDVQEAPTSKHPFPQLKEVKIRRYYSTSNEIEFVFYMLENAISLERMILDATCRLCYGCKLKHLSHELPRQCIRGEVASSTAKLIIVHHSNERTDFASVFMAMQNDDAISSAT